MTKIKFAYWDAHGLGLSIRYLLEFVGADYEEKVYKPETRDEWFKEKNNLGLLFPNLPYLIDGENKLTEHMAIIRYIGKKFNLAPENEKETILVDQVESFICDLRIKLYKVCYDQINYEKSKKEYIDMVGDKLENLEKLFSHHTYVVGKRLTYIDIYLFDYLFVLNSFDDQVLQNKPNLTKYLNHMKELPSIKAYKNSNRWKIRTFCGPLAVFNKTY